MSTEYLDLADYIAIAAAVTGLDLQTVMNMTNHDLADSALHARLRASATPTSIRTSSTRPLYSL